MAEKAIMLQLRPKFQELRDARTYTEADVKRILYAFARDYEHRQGLRPMRADTLRRFIETAFNFD